MFLDNLGFLNGMPNPRLIYSIIASFDYVRNP